MSRHRVYLLVAVADLAAARAAAASLDEDNDGRSFKAALSASGTLPATHHGANVMVDDLRVAALEGAAQSIASARIAVDPPGAFKSFAAEHGLKVVVGSMT